MICIQSLKISLTKKESGVRLNICAKKNLKLFKKDKKRKKKWIFGIQSELNRVIGLFGPKSDSIFTIRKTGYLDFRIRIDPLSGLNNPNDEFDCYLLLPSILFNCPIWVGHAY